MHKRIFGKYVKNSYIAENKIVVNILINILCFFIIQGILVQRDKYSDERDKMVETQIKARGISDHEVLRAMRKVPRHLFVPEEYARHAYGDYPLPIGQGQTISQPYIVAYMTEIVHPSKGKKALEIGTGSGYQAAILGEIADTVYSLEIVSKLAEEASSLLKTLGYKNIFVKAGDGYNGWPEHAPFDIIIVTAAADAIPKPLIDQLAENGRLVIPLGRPGAIQELKLVVKKRGKINISRLMYVKFVPFTRSD
jgi:protein-L-isoaspartate(D-aspartate) O-methyltransferase